MVKSLKRNILKSQGVRKLKGYTCALPDFIIIGAQKSGTSSLYNNLTRHPNIIPAKDYFDSKKEVRFFSRHFKKGEAWYRSHFASTLYVHYYKMAHGRKLLTGESTPAYIFFPHALRRIHETLPKVKQILLLRNPVDRAYSHYQHVVRLGRENLSFEEAIEAEPERIYGERNKILSDEDYKSFEYMYHSYLTRGIYADQLEEWISLFSMENILILKSEDYFTDQKATYKKVLNFLGLPDWDPGKLTKCNVGNYRDMKKRTRENLLKFFNPHNERLYQLLGKNFDWEQSSSKQM